MKQIILNIEPNNLAEAFYAYFRSGDILRAIADSEIAIDFNDKKKVITITRREDRPRFSDHIFVDDTSLVAPSGLAYIPRDSADRYFHSTPSGAGGGGAVPVGEAMSPNNTILTTAHLNRAYRQLQNQIVNDIESRLPLRPDADVFNGVEEQG